MNIKVIIADDNDIIFNNLSNIVSQYKELKIELKHIPKDKLNTFINKIKSSENLIVLDSVYSVYLCNNILKHTVNQMFKKDIIILVIDSKKITNTSNNKHKSFFTKKSNFSLFDIVETFVNTINDTLEIEHKIDSILWQLGFTFYFKGTIYLKDAILLAFNDKELLRNMSTLIKKVTEKNAVSSPKAVRSAIDKSLNNVLDYKNINIVSTIFGSDYDGRKISLKYLIELCIRYLERQYYFHIKQI